MSNVDGQYVIENIPTGEHLVSVTYVGYATIEESVTISEGENILNFEMDVDMVGLDEMVVVGYGERVRRDVTGSVSSVSAEQLKIHRLPLRNSSSRDEPQVFRCLPHPVLQAELLTSVSAVHHQSRPAISRCMSLMVYP